MYKKYDLKGGQIITKIKNEIARGKIYENQGQKELRQFQDMLGESELTYQEQCQLLAMLEQVLESL